jgi:hypothetical protein
MPSSLGRAVPTDAFAAASQFAKELEQGDEPGQRKWLAVPMMCFVLPRVVERPGKHLVLDAGAAVTGLARPG